VLERHRAATDVREDYSSPDAQFVSGEGVDTLLNYDAPDYLNVFVAAVRHL